MYSHTDYFVVRNIITNNFYPCMCKQRTVSKKKEGRKGEKVGRREGWREGQRKELP